MMFTLRHYGSGSKKIVRKEELQVNQSDRKWFNEYPNEEQVLLSFGKIPISSAHYWFF